MYPAGERRSRFYRTVCRRRPIAQGRPHMLRTSRLNRYSFALCFASAGLLLTGCGSSFSPAGSGFSEDRFTYESTEWSPKTVELIDTRTDQTLWSIDIPVGQKLTMQFETAYDNDNTEYPERMKWVVQPISKRSWKGKESMLVPGPTSRLIEMTLRPAPEAMDQTVAMPELPAIDDSVFEPVEMETDSAEDEPSEG